MEPSSRTPEGDDNTCRICGHGVRIDPTRPPGDATCPHCGALLWFSNESDAATDIQAARQWQRANAAIEAHDLPLAERLLRMALTLDPSNAEIRKVFEDVKARNRADKGTRRRGRKDAQQN